MKTLENIENGSYSLNDFNDEQLNLLKILVKLAYQEGFDDGVLETKSKILKALDDED